MRFSELKSKDVINLRDCKKLGRICDLEFDECGQMDGNQQINGTREFITIYSGELTLVFDDHEYVLKAGDHASYNAFDKYTYKNTGKGMVTANIVVHYPN